MAIKDITKTGAQSYQDIQEQNELYEHSNIPWYDLPVSQRMQYHQKRRMETLPVRKVGYEEIQQWGDFGNSKYDVNVPLSALQNLEAWRGKNQSAGRQWVHGITKGVGLAATTFLDGTLGLLYGIGQGIVDGRLSALWDNDLSNALQDLNQKMEEWLPNYRTQEEQERNWRQNIGTANFWADGFLKNLGFSVGAFYSGNAWLKGLKALGWVKNAASAQAVGSLLSGFNEGRIEANNAQRDFLTLQNQLISDARERRAMEIAANPYNSDEVKIRELKTLDDNVKLQQDDALQRAHQMGMATLIGNTLILTADNMWQFGKLYSRGFANAKGIMGRIEDGMMKQGIKGGIKEGGKYVAETVSKPRAILRGFSNAASEGFEELNQAAIAEGAGYWRGVDSPDAYYEALKDPKAQLQTKRFFEALGTGLTNTYGNGDRWEEFAIGFLTGAIGMPTFGNGNNADANTWLGRGRRFGISGGIVGEYKNQMQQSRENEESARVMNAYLDKLATNANYFSQSQSFTNAMDGFAASNNKFEYENMSNNDDFAAISRFAKAGRLDDLKELVKQDFENMSDEQLADIAVNTTPNIIRKDDGTIAYEDINGNVATGGWRDITGKLMSETPEGRQQMREELVKKRDKILHEIDQYEKSVETVRAIGNNGLTEDQVNNLAWLNWKTKILEDRYGSLKSDLDERGVLTDLQGTVNNYVENIENADPSSLSEDASEVKKHMQLLGQYIEALRQSKTAMQLGQLVDANTEFQKALDSPLIEAASGISHDVFVETMTQLQDLAKIGKAANQFNTSYKDFVEHPINLIKNRQKIDRKKQKEAETMNREDKRTKVRETTVPEIVHAADIGEMSLDELEEMFPDDAEVQGKVKQAQAIRDDSQRVTEILGEDESITEQTHSDAMKLLDESKSVATDEEQLLDLEREAFNDPALLYSEDDPTLQDIPSQEELQDVLGERLDNAKTVLSKAIAQLRSEQASAAEATASPETITPVTEVIDNGEVGRDSVDKVEAINEQKEQPADPVASTTNRILQEVEKVSTIHDDIRDSYINNLSELVRLTEASKDAGMSKQETYDVVRESSMWNVLANLNTATGPVYIKWLDDLYAGKTQENPAPRGQEEVEISYVPTANEVESQVNDIQQVQDDGRLGDILPDQYKYWKPTITELPIHTTRGSKELFYKVAGTMTKNGGTPRFTKQQLQRIEAVGNYLVQNGAYNRVNIGQGVQAGDIVRFRIEKTLNNQAGEPVILITDKDGNVIGDIMSLNDPLVVNQTGLVPFINRVLAEYKKAGEPDVFISQETLVIDKHMVGKVPFTAIGNRISLNQLHTNPNGGRMQFKLGIAMSDGPQAKMIMTPGRTKDPGQSAEDLSIIPALTAKKGQPFFLMPTGDKKGRNRYIPVPFIMPKFNEVGTESALYKAVQSIVSQIATGNNSTAALIGNNLQELLGLQDIHINYNGDNVKVHVKTKSMEHQVKIYNGARNAENLVSSIMQGLQMIKAPIQVSRKYINTTYNGMNYNEMIGEYIMVNLNQGDTHTVSDWFTIRPLDAAGKPIKTVSPRSTGRNTNTTAISEKLIAVPFKGNPVQVNLKTKEVFFNGQSYRGKRANAALAYAYGIENELDMYNPYQTEWGYFNPNTFQFEPLTVTKTMESELTQPYQLNLNVNEETIKVNSIEQGLAIGQLYEMYDELEEDEFNRLKNQILDANTPEEIESARKVIPMSNAAKNGWEDHKQDILESLQEQIPKEEAKPVTTPSRPQSVNPDGEALKMGLISDPLSKIVWGVLSQDTKKVIVDKPFIIAKQMMNKLRLNYDATRQEFKKPINEILGVEKYREANKSQSFDLNKELSWLSRVLPQFSSEERLQLVNGLTKMDGSTSILGMFKKGVIYLNTANQSRGTTYHEAFHAVFNTLMSDKEVANAYQSARSKWGNLSDLELEERLAEDFRQYVEYEEYGGEGLKSALSKMWRKFKRMIGHLFGKDSALNKLYYNISRGNYANREVQEALDYNERYRVEEDDPQTFKALRKIQKAINKLGGINVGESGITRLITKERNRQFFVINRASQINRSQSNDGDYMSRYYQSNRVLEVVKNRLVREGLTDAVSFVKYGNTYRLKLIDQNAANNANTAGYQYTITGSEDDFMDIEEYDESFDRLSAEEQMEAFNNGIQSAEQWDELTQAERNNFKACFLQS